VGASVLAKKLNDNAGVQLNPALLRLARPAAHSSQNSGRKKARWGGGLDVQRL